MTLTADEVRARLLTLREHDLPTHGGRTLAYVYDSGRPDVDAVAREAVAAFAGTNGLDPSVFPLSLIHIWALGAKRGIPLRCAKLTTLVSRNVHPGEVRHKRRRQQRALGHAATGGTVGHG